ncbi:hypothetical protein CPB85DRAFT_1213355 [Mucidula mucida]|nr:hypothetical protein CPB85DRAFT_1213355 [Mucidula mucida]
MSCTVCRMAFVPGPRATSPFRAHYPPDGLMPSSLYSYFIAATGIGPPDIHTLKGKYDYVSGNMFSGANGPIVMCVVWESDTVNNTPTTAFMMHTVCAGLLLHRMDADPDTIDKAVRLAEVVGVLERPMGGDRAGRLKDVRYESAGDKIDLNPFWTVKRASGGNVFNWKALSESPYAYLISKPNVFPRFHTQVAPTRISPLDTIEFENTDMLTSLPLDIFETLIPHLSIQSYVMLMSTCRYLRFHALTTFQSHARRFVLQLPWSIPIPAELSDMKDDSIAKLPNRDSTPHDADWYLYLSHIHRTNGMRTRKWIWSLVEEIHDTYEAKCGTSPAMDPKTPRYREVHGPVKQAFEMGQMGRMFEKQMKAKAK